MPIVTARELRDRMSGPEWSSEMERDAGRLVVELEASLAARLGTYISPGAVRTERCYVSEHGMAITNYPVAQIVAIDSVPAVIIDKDTTEPPPGWALVDHFVRRIDLTSGARFPSPAIYDTRVSTDLDGLAGMLSGMSGYGGVDGPGAVHEISVTYAPGWGKDQGLRSAIITKARAVMINAHDDTITARSLEGTRSQPATEDWTDSEVAGLAKYRGMPGPMTTRW